MNKEAKNEIDLMLRQLGRRGGDTVFDDGEEHLDADELNSYVANALPAAARARYMEHLADCASCRGLVAQLSAAQGPVVVEQAVSVPASSALKQFLASLFSPMVLRYAVPVLGMILIVIAGFVVMRRGPAADSVALLTQREANNIVAQSASPSPQPPLYHLDDQQANRPAESTTAKPAPAQGDSSVATSEERTSSAVTVDQPPVATPETLPYANSPSPVAPPSPKAVANDQEEAQRRADREKKAEADAAPPAKRTEVIVKERGAQPTSAEPERARIAQTPAPAVNSPASGLGSLAAGESRRRARDEAVDKTTAKDDAAKAKNEAAAETRSVGGRRFRKSGNVWIDTAYDSSRQTFSLRRGSEQYRALVADEPEIGRIADQLEGEFVVVWKNRAYRIR